MLIVFSVILPVWVLTVFLFPKKPETGENVYHVAVAGPMTGSVRKVGAAMVQGASLYLDKANREGKLEGRKIKLIAADDKNNKQRAMSLASDFIAHKKCCLCWDIATVPPPLSLEKFIKKDCLPSPPLPQPVL